MNIRKSFVNPFSCAPFFDAKYFFLWMVLSEWLFSLILSPFLPSLFQFFFLSQSTDPIQNIDTKRISIHNRCNERRRKKKLEQKGFCTFFFSSSLNPSAKSFVAIVSQHSSINAYIRPMLYKFRKDMYCN